MPVVAADVAAGELEVEGRRQADLQPGFPRVGSEGVLGPPRGETAEPVPAEQGHARMELDAVGGTDPQAVAVAVARAALVDAGRSADGIASTQTCRADDAGTVRNIVVGEAVVLAAEARTEGRGLGLAPSVMQRERDSVGELERLALDPRVAASQLEPGQRVGRQRAVEPQGDARLRQVEVRQVVVHRAVELGDRTDRPGALAPELAACLQPVAEAGVALARDLLGQPDVAASQHRVVVVLPADLQPEPRPRLDRLGRGQRALRLGRPGRVRPLVAHPLQGPLRGLGLAQLGPCQPEVVGGHRLDVIAVQPTRRVEGRRGGLRALEAEGDEALVEGSLRRMCAPGLGPRECPVGRASAWPSDRSLQAEDERIGGRDERRGRAGTAGLGSLQAEVRDLVDTMLRGRWTDAHLVTVLLERGAALYGEHPVERAQSFQTATANRLQQLAVEHWSRLRRDDTAAMLWTLSAATQAITLGFAAVAPADVALDDLAEPLAEAFAAALSAPLPTAGLAQELVTAWRTERKAGGDRPIADRLPGLRSRLLRGDEPLDPARMAPLAFALGCLPTLMSLSPGTRPGVSDEALDRELAILSAALLLTANPRT